MSSANPNQNNKEILRPVPELEEDVADLEYGSDAIPQGRTRLLFAKHIAKGISMVKTTGQKAYGLLVLENSRDFLYDLGHIALFRAMVEKAGLPFDLKCIDMSDDYPDQFPRELEVQVPQTTADDIMAGHYNSLESIIIDGRTLGDDGSPSTVVPPRRKTKKPNKFSHSKFVNPRGREDAA